MHTEAISKIVNLVYDLWPVEVAAQPLSKLWDTYDVVEDRLSGAIEDHRERLMAFVVNYTLYLTIAQALEATDQPVVVRSKFPLAKLLPLLQRHANDPTLQPELFAVIGFAAAG